MHPCIQTPKVFFLDVKHSHLLFDNDHLVQANTPTLLPRLCDHASYSHTSSWVGSKCQLFKFTFTSCRRHYVQTCSKRKACIRKTDDFISLRNAVISNHTLCTLLSTCYMHTDQLYVNLQTWTMSRDTST